MRLLRTRVPSRCNKVGGLLIKAICVVALRAAILDVLPYTTAVAVLARLASEPF